jgi:hypothetical protein
MAESQLRAYVCLDSLQPQLAAHVRTACRGYFPVPYEASLYVEAILKHLEAREEDRIKPEIVSNTIIRGIDVTPFSDFGRLYMAGDEATIDSAAATASAGVSGRERRGDT